MANSKSAYSVAGKKQKLDTHIIVVWVDNEAGVLARVVGLFSGRGYNIESLAVAEIDQKMNISTQHNQNYTINLSWLSAVLYMINFINSTDAENKTFIISK